MGLQLKTLNCQEFVKSVADNCALPSCSEDNPDDLTQSIDHIVCESVDEFAPISQWKTENKQRSKYVLLTWRSMMPND